jgi:signal transduction histidine kinase/CheY-like chemotaxis protein
MGISPLFFPDLNNETTVLLVTLFLVTPIFASTVFAAPYFPIHVFWTLGSVLPLSAYFIFSGVTDFIVLGLSLLLAGVPSALVLGWILAVEFKRGLRTHFENIRLIDELRHEKTRVEEINHDKSRFLAAVSHDLRQPLHALDLFHASLKSKLNQQESKELLALASHSSRALGEMLGELIDISRLDAGKINPEPRTMPLTPLLRECAEEIQPLADKKGLKLRIYLPRKGCVKSDPVLLKRILRNLLSNAVRHTENGGVLLGARMRGSDVRIEVYDTGSGIDKTQLPHIFDEFYQVDNPERDREKGLGLGLAIVRRLADMLGHDIHVHSQLGKGSCFSVVVPLCSEAEASLHKMTKPMGDVDVAGLFVPVVDDDRIILKGMRKLLLDWGCEVLLAESEHELLHELGTHNYPHPDILICDYRLRDKRTGVEVVKAVRGHFGDAEIPAIIISGDVHPDVQQKVKAAGCNWLEKPVSADILKRMIAELTG